MRSAGGERERRRLWDQASSRGESGQSGAVNGAWGGLAWCRLVLGMGGGKVPHPPWICRVGVWGRWRLVVRVEWLSRMGVGSGGPFGVDVPGGYGSWYGRGGPWW